MKNLFKMPFFAMAMFATMFALGSCEKPTDDPNKDDNKEEEKAIELSIAKAALIETGDIDVTIALLESDDYKMQTYFIAEGKEGLELVAGTYTVSEDATAGTALVGQIQNDQPTGTVIQNLLTEDVYVVVGGEFVVEEKDGEYKITAELETEDGEEFNFVYEGELEVFDNTTFAMEPEEKISVDLTFTADTITNLGAIFNGVEADVMQIILLNEKQEFAQLLCFVEKGTNDFVGTYNFEVGQTTGAAKTILPGSFNFDSSQPSPSAAVIGGNIYYLVGGSVSVANDKTTIACTTGKGSTINGTFEGQFEVATEPLSAPMLKAKTFMAPAEGAKFAAINAFRF